MPSVSRATPILPPVLWKPKWWGPIISDAEMGCEVQTWDDVRARLLAAAPLQYATDIPQAMLDTLSQFSSYESLFQMAFGSPEITGERIAFAIATYERTLLADQTPLDQFIAGNPNALSPQQVNGMNVFLNNCLPCHGGPFSCRWGLPRHRSPSRERGSGTLRCHRESR